MKETFTPNERKHSIRIKEAFYPSIGTFDSSDSYKRF